MILSLLAARGSRSVDTPPPGPDPSPPASATSAPWNSSIVPCVIPTPDGSGATIHPSVLDMGTEWNGYRWWMANTPYPGAVDDYENPCIYGSNDRRTWAVPAGVVNPIDPNPGDPWFHSDTELVWDVENSRLVLFYRLGSSATTPPTIYLRAQSSPDGSTWTDHGTIATLPGDGARLSPAVARVGPGEWRMWAFANTLAAHLYTATNPLGPWTDAGALTRAGSPFTGWHGDVIWHDGKWLAAYTSSSTSGLVYVSSSLDGLAWTAHSLIMNGGAGGGWDDTPYRLTLLPSTVAGYIDCWYSAYGTTVPGGCATDYVRLPDTLWPTP